jgi:O-antigen ligase
MRVERHSKEISMYIGGGILGTILVVLLIVWLVRRV